jgi:hypothetical protein
MTITEGWPFPKKTSGIGAYKEKETFSPGFCSRSDQITASTEMIDITHYEVLYSLPDIFPLRFGRPGL